MTQRQLDRLLSPASLAVFGASDKPARVGMTVWRNLAAGGFKGQRAGTCQPAAEDAGRPSLLRRRR